MSKDKDFLEEITEVYLFVSSSVEFGEGILGHHFITPNGIVNHPLVCADKKRVDSFRPLAKKISDELGIKVKLVKMTKREVLEVYEPVKH